MCRLPAAPRAYQPTPEGRAPLRERVVPEHGLARLGQLGIGQARSRGRKKTRFQRLMAASIAKLRRRWNGQQAQALSGAHASGAPQPLVRTIQYAPRPALPFREAIGRFLYIYRTTARPTCRPTR
jgi:hypothetical protein